MHNNGLAEQTVSTRIHVLTAFSARCDITNPYEVKETLANLNAWSKSTKKKFVTTYSIFLKTINKTWQAPKYKPEQKIPFIPTETEIDQLIAACSPRTATLLQTLKETGARIGEAVNLKWIDLNTESKTLTITPEKGSNPRILEISDKLDMLNRTKRKNEYIFSRMINHIRTLFCDQRKRLAEKLNSPRISKTSFHTFRHWKGTTEYHTTKT